MIQFSENTIFFVVVLPAFAFNGAKLERCRTSIPDEARGAEAVISRFRFKYGDTRRHNNIARSLMVLRDT